MGACAGLERLNGIDGMACGGGGVSGKARDELDRGFADLGEHED